MTPICHVIEAASSLIFTEGSVLKAASVERDGFLETLDPSVGLTAGEGNKEETKTGWYL